MVLLGDVIDSVVDDVFANPILTTTPEPNDRRQPFKGTSVEAKSLELAGLDLKRQIGDGIEARHGLSLDERGGGRRTLPAVVRRPPPLSSQSATRRVFSSRSDPPRTYPP